MTKMKAKKNFSRWLHRGPLHPPQQPVTFTVTGLQFTSLQSLSTAIYDRHTRQLGVAWFCWVVVHLSMGTEVSRGPAGSGVEWKN